MWFDVEVSDLQIKHQCRFFWPFLATFSKNWAESGHTAPWLEHWAKNVSAFNPPGIPIKPFNFI